MSGILPTVRSSSQARTRSLWAVMQSSSQARTQKHGYLSLESSLISKRSPLCVLCASVLKLYLLLCSRPRRLGLENMISYRLKFPFQHPLIDITRLKTVDYYIKKLYGSEKCPNNLKIYFMTNEELVLLLLACSFGAGLLGSLSGLGGGMIIVPLLTLGLGVDIHYAIGASLVTVIATSTGSSVAYVREGYSNIRVGLLLETATCLGALGGVILGTHLPAHLLFLLFGAVLTYCAISSFFNNGIETQAVESDTIATIFKLDSTYPVNGALSRYHVQHVPLGYAIMILAGALSGILGIGSGAFKVIALDRVMQIPFKVSTTTSNFMMGVTAAVSAAVYFNLGYLDPVLIMPIIFGVVFGSIVGARLLPKMRIKLLRRIFASMLLLIAIQMIYSGL